MFQALELNPQEKNALVARSQCYVLLGNPTQALKDAEAALVIDKNFIKALYQKAEALYYMGEFEHSLVYYHRGLKIRPDLERFQQGVNKAQKAIENAIGSPFLPKAPLTPESKFSSKSNASKSSKASTKLCTIPKQLCVEIKYLDNLLKHPDIKSKIIAESDVTETIKETVDYLNTRKEFWRQQLPP